jgi:hypothetical protein
MEKWRIPSAPVLLNAEGTEIIVAPSLIFSGVVCKAIDVAFGEWHDARHIPAIEPIDKDGSGEAIKFKDWQEANTPFLTFWRAMKFIDPNDCKARWLEIFDEEDYLHDGVPFHWKLHSK